jgi:hypothetical protein
VVEYYEQSMKKEPEVKKVISFDTFEEAERFYMLHKRSGNWPWSFWSYPKEVKQ